MTQREVFVYVDLEGHTRLAGTLWWRVRGGRETATFAYDQAWLDNPNRFSLEPALPTLRGAFQSSEQALFRAISDSAPDRWGRKLMERNEARRAAGGPPRTLFEIDFLLMVDDRARQGALRFTEREGGDFLASNERGPIPPFLELSALLSAAQDADADEETEEELQLLLAPGSSLGGARPKASVMDPKGRLAIAKFPKADDRIDVVRWEAVALALAREAHIVIPEWSLESASSRPVLVSRRFDRRGKIRIPYLSAVSMLETAERESHTYMDLADALTRHGAQPIEDKRELWRRMVFNMLISNTDNHLRNHGFVRQGQLGWRLAPAFDLNPVPAFLGPRVFATGLDGGDLSVARALDVAHYFQLDGSEARAAMGDVAQAVSLWRQIAKDLGVARTEIDRMRSAFEHADLKLAGVPS